MKRNARNGRHIPHLIRRSPQLDRNGSADGPMGGVPRGVQPVVVERVELVVAKVLEGKDAMVRLVAAMID